MAANSRLKELNVSLAISSSPSSVKTENSDEQYTEDFHSSLQSNFEEISSKMSQISTDYSVKDVDDFDQRVSKFVGKRLQVLKENQVERTGKSTDDLGSQENHKELGPFWIKKLDILRQRNTSNHEGKLNIGKINRKSENKYDICTNKCNNIKPVANVNEIGYFQSAYERLKFENLREKYRGFLNTDIQSLESCKKCQEMQDELLKATFYKNCARKVKQNIVEDKLAEYMQSRSSALLIADIIKDGPNLSWNSDEIWDKLLSGGYQHVNSMNQN